MKDFQITHRANGIARIKQCIDACKQPATVRGTVFTTNWDKFLNRLGISETVTGLKHNARPFDGTAMKMMNFSVGYPI